MHKTELELALRYATTPEELRAAIASAIVEVDRLIQLAEDLLVLARSERGQAGARPAAGRRRRPARRRARALRRPAIDEAGRSLVVEPANGLTVEGDRLRLEQALTNLVENAHRSTAAGEITVRAQRGRRRVGDPRRGPRPGLPAGVPRPRLRALQPRRSRRAAATAPGSAWRSSRRSPAPTAAAPTPPTGTASGADVWIELPRRSPELSSEAARHASES